MNTKLLEAYDALPFPDRKDIDLHGMLRHTPMRDFSHVCPCQFAMGISLRNCEAIPETALASLKKALQQASIPLNETGVPFTAHIDSSYEKEEYSLQISKDAVHLTASGAEGLRYAAYDFEDALLGANGEGAIEADIHRKPQIKHRITRSFLSPNCRPPLMLDELEDDFDYYPDEYLDAIAHERLNGIWITIYLNDMPSSFFPERGELAAKKLGKLRTVVEKCARYGIKCYLYMSEPRKFDGGWKNNSKEDLAKYPEMGGHVMPNGTSFFCTSSEIGQAYMKEVIGYVADNVPGLGGIINIMCCETTWPCATWKMYPQVMDCNCPRCSQRTAPELFTSMARLMKDALCSRQPEAVFIAWFYYASYIPGEAEHDIINQIAAAWPEDIPMMRNAETGGLVRQMGRDLYVQDYSLSFGHASDAWKTMASHLKHPAAKIQTCTSHEDATVPYLPVPGKLYGTYKDLLEHGCDTVMQCWYFGNYPCLMNSAAGRLSFLPLPENEMAFLEELARPVWGANAKEAAQCWRMFSDAYGNFPEELAFKWFGPLHSSIVFPWYLMPRDLPMAPSYTQYFPKNSGDRIYECICYSHTPDTTLTLMEKMEIGWQEALDKLRAIAHTKEQLAELEVAEAVGLQIKSTCNMLRFYALREDMIYTRHDRLPEIRQIVKDEIANTLAMNKLCLSNELLGYHAEVESYMFYPQKLAMRAKLLENLLEAECQTLDLEAKELCQYRGDVDCETDLHLGKPFALGGVNVVFTRNASGNIDLDITGKLVNATLYLEPGRLCRIICSAYTPNGRIIKEHGLTMQCINDEHLRYTIDMEFFAPYRHSDNQPMRINIVCNDVALSPLHPHPMRLRMGTANSADLVWLKL